MIVGAVRKRDRRTRLAVKAVEVTVRQLRYALKKVDMPVICVAITIIGEGLQSVAVAFGGARYRIDQVRMRGSKPPFRERA